MTILSLVLLALIIMGSCYALFSVACVLAFFTNGDVEKQTRAAKTALLPSVSVLKPIKGLDQRLEENLSSFCVQDYPSYEVLFGFRDADDPAIPVAVAVGAAAPCDARVIIRDTGRGANQKMVNLRALADVARYPMLALSDSDMAVEREYLRRIMAEFESGDKTGIVTSLYKVSRPSSLGSALESLTIALDFIPSVLTARRLEGVTFGLGASILISGEALGRIGGFAALTDYLADDYQLGFRLWKEGYRNVISRHVIENRIGPMTLGEHLTHQLRWARTYRASRPGGFFGYGIAHSFFFALVLLCVRPSTASVAVVLGVLALRCLIALILYRKVIREKSWLKWLFLLPFKDVLAFLVWLWSFADNRVVWRGTRYRIVRGGRMTPA